MKPGFLRHYRENFGYKIFTLKQEQSTFIHYPTRGMPNIFFEPYTNNTLNTKMEKMLAPNRVSQPRLVSQPDGKEKRASSPFCSGKASGYWIEFPLEYKRKHI